MYGITYFKRVVSTCSVQYSKKGGSKKLLEFLANMPRTSNDILEAQRQRLNIAKKAEHYPVSTIYLQVLGSGARGVPNTLYLFTDQKRYLFNCGESTQRLAHEHKARLSRLEHIFITGKSWKNIGGLPGISLTLQDVGVPSLTLHGPEGLDELYNATKRFVIMKEMNVQMAKCTPNEDFVDNVMSVKYVLLGPDEDVLDPQPLVKKPKKEEKFTEKEFEEFIHDDTDYYNRPNKPETNKNKSPKHNARGQPDFRDPVKSKTEKVLLHLQKKSNYTVAYICTFKKRYGMLDLKKCVERGVKPGPLLGKLKMGEDVVLEDGTLVLSREVKTPDDPGPVFIVMEVPDISYLKESEFSAHFYSSSTRPENIPQLVVHMTPPHVFHHPTYTSFMEKFGPTTKHLVLNSQNSCLGSEAVHRTQNKLHLLDADMFPLLRDVSLPAVWNAHPPVATTDSPAKLKGLEELKNKIALAQFQTIINMEGSGKGDVGPRDRKLDVVAGRTLTTFHLRPKRELDRSLEPKLQIEEYIREAMAEDGFPASLDKFRKIVESVRYAKNASQTEYPKVVFLGTGSCIPSKTRNTSAIAIQIDETRSMLLDCGEGTFGQLVRFFGPKRVNQFLKTLKAIYVSHLHADHHLGLIGLLQERRKALSESSTSNLADEALYLLAPGQIVSWLATYDLQFERIRGEFTLIPNQNLLVGPDETPGMSPAVLANIGVHSVRTCYVTHCPNAFGVTVDVDGQHRITYSGDTIPCDALVELGKNSTLLIHEATMEDELADEARYKMHSTTSQAIDIGRRMNAKYTVLTHFSQRYARLPRLNAHILNDNTSVGIAFDNMQITMNDLDLLPHMYAPLQLMFAEHCVDMEVRAAQRAVKKARRTASPAAAATHDNPTKQNPSQVAVNVHAPPIKKAMYRDSHASRLRSEIRRMVGKGPVKCGCRSKSCSSTTTKSAGSVTPRSNNSENTSPERPIDVKTPQSVSDTSRFGQDSLDRSKAVANEHVIDTRSKTLNYASAAPYSDKVCDSKITNKKIDLINAPAPKDFSGGYGKPLVTPVNKKLLIRRLPNGGINDTEKSTSNTSNRCKSTVKNLKADNRPSSASVTSYKREVSKTRIPANTFGQSGQKPRWSSSGPTSDVRNMKNATVTNHVTSIQQRISLNPRRTSSAHRNPDDTKSLTSTHCSQYDRKVKSWNTDSISPQRKSPRSQTPNGMRGQMFNLRATVNKLPESQERLTDKTMKNTPPVTNNGTNSKLTNHSNKSFKPQLEDIKSSYLLLHKKDKHINETADNGDEVKQTKTNLNESMRKVQLLEAKQKYKSKQFWNDSKYDKIEGLNWISWK